MKYSRKIMYAVAIVLSLGILFFFSMPQADSLKLPGPMNTGHEQLACIECHVSVSGTTRQQIQNNVKYWIGLETNMVDFAYKIPGNKDCLACHDREDDQHPVYRFNEPKYTKVRKEIHPEKCLSCHKEHHGVRVTSELTNCKSCHESLKLKHDPLDISHEILIKNKKWNTCLGCHDFHGNHKWEVPKKESHMILENTLKSYFKGANSPYGKETKSKAKESRYEN